jgi:GAF domain-containing protein
MKRRSPRSAKAEGSPTKADLLARIAGLEKRLRAAAGALARKDGETQALARELAETGEQQTATSEILRVISSSPTDLQSVMDTVALSAARLCSANDAQIFRLEGDTLRRVAQFGSLLTLEVVPLTRAWIASRAVIDRQIVHVLDRAAEVEIEFPEGRDVQQRVGHRTTLAIPMLYEEAVIGSIFIARTEVRPFSDNQIALLKTFADQSVIAIENVRLFTALQARNRDLTDALDKQTATSEILRVISRAPTDVQPVFDAIVRNAVRLSGAVYGSVNRFDGERVHFIAHHNYTPEQLERWRLRFPRALDAAGATGRVIATGRPLLVGDVEADPHAFTAEGRADLVTRGARSVLIVPMFWRSDVIGTINLSHRNVGAFGDAHVELLKTFADQAVIAIENARLFNELAVRNRDLTEALEQQTATSEILRVISRSQTDVQPVFDTIVRSAARLCDGLFSALYQFDGELLDLVAQHNYTPEAIVEVHRIFPARPTRGLGVGRAILERAVVHIPDVEMDPEFQIQGLTRAIGMRSGLFVPMLREGAPIGVIAVARAEPGPFSDTEIELLKTFADQAVIAVENVRLFTELQASNRDLTTALDTQTATSDILRVISRSQTDVQPVFDAIVASAVRLLGAYSGVLTRIAGDQIELAALTSTDDAGDAALRATFPRPLHSEEAHAQAMRDRTPVNIADTETDSRRPEAVRAAARARGYRSAVVVPLLRHDEAIGAIAVNRREPGGFTDDEIALLKTFADQAVIAIENARLLTELQARTAELTSSVQQLTALGDVGRAVSSSLDLDTVLTTIVGRAVQLSGTDGGTIFEYDEGSEEFSPRATLNADEGQSAMLRATRLRRGEGAVGQMAVTRAPIQIPDISAEGAYESRLRGALLGAGTRALLAIPLLHENRIVGGLVVSRRTPGEFTAEVVEILKTFATQSALAIQNARLFREIEDKSHQLEVASQHKSEFLANMSHELRTPLNAIIGFSEVLAEGMFGEINDKQAEYLRDILESGRHLLSLINDILDLSKIEAGRMELEATDFDLPAAIDNALTLVRERAGRRGIALGRTIDEQVGMIRADERKVKQVLLNLLSNALKFTPEGGRVDVRAAVNEGMVEVSMADTGMGIAPEDQEAVFEEFRQVGTAAKKVEGTGLGLALSRKFIELHGGRIWVKSEVGVGSTFTFTLPLSR